MTSSLGTATSFVTPTTIGRVLLPEACFEESIQPLSQGIEPRMHLVPKAPLRAFDRVPDDPLDVRG